MSLVLLRFLVYPDDGLLAMPAVSIAGTRVPALDGLLVALACYGALVLSPYLLEISHRWNLAARGTRYLPLTLTAVLLLAGLSALVYGIAI